MVLLFKDFVPRRQHTSQRVTDARGVYQHAYMTESWASVMARVNEFMRRHALEVVNVETLLLTNPEQAHLTEFPTGSKHTTVQAVRVWYNATAEELLSERYTHQFDSESQKGVPLTAEL
ncbi:uncharacterized protein MONBRDRAFT_13127 [Monosiga brevicollis MX1]|uniref:Uncharacterized protein n=1 Tax=Monosiga brevicollis TaxID=81824 RepID=A9VED2_MONBE|nr:uncharacterized protein MONBRDRAFT_13127 [Monosiga brevicollis MX1]EDQ84110.1 predicted protein [Monosiga brevicollis MX1]|eukprot:XP_001751079.1 hypothetical protein [Monosiga brevicollis MX1]